RGRKGFEDRDYPQPAFFRAMLDAALSADTASIDKEGLDGKEIAKAIRSRRVDRIREAKAALIAREE
ncbi:MAG: multifunctional CCA tRNA nucleotidyl transferase/2'3'-cyclic phosphodiesterase/2'nucleotidase/phosphatase, partial [Gammaproteobacteria bacterium]